MRETIRQIEQYIKEGKSSAEEASSYLRAHSHEWNVEHEKHWQKLALKSRSLLGKAFALREKLERKEPLQ